MADDEKKITEADKKKLLNVLSFVIEELFAQEEMGVKNDILALRKCLGENISPELKAKLDKVKEWALVSLSTENINSGSTETLRLWYLENERKMEIIHSTSKALPCNIYLAKF